MVLPDTNDVGAGLYYRLGKRRLLSDGFGYQR